MSLCGLCHTDPIPTIVHFGWLIDPSKQIPANTGDGTSDKVSSLDC